MLEGDGMKTEIEKEPCQMCNGYDCDHCGGTGDEPDA